MGHYIGADVMVQENRRFASARPEAADGFETHAYGSWLVLAFVTGLAVYAFRVALAGRPMLSGAFFSE
jgi:hypothetical protein